MESETLKVINDTKLVSNDQGGHSDSFGINLESFRTLKCLKFHKQMIGSEHFLKIFATRILKYKCISSFHRTTINKVDVLDLGIMWLMAVEIANIIKLYQPPFRARSRP